VRRAIVIGLDGATFDLLLPLMDKGHLPALKRLMDEGAWGRLRTVIPPGTGPAWATIITGLDPSNHGIADLIVRAEDSYDLAFLNGASLRAPTLWDIVGQQGGRVLVLNVPMSYPPREVQGRMITGLLTPVGSDRCTWPPEFWEAVRRAEPSYRIVPREAYVPGKAGAYLEEVTSLVGAKGRLLKQLLRGQDWTFAMQVFSETDFLQHALWHVIDPAHPRHTSADERRYGPRIIDFYKQIDDLVGQVVREAGDDVSVVVISDHGAGPLHEFIHANNLLIENGMLKVKRSIRSQVKRLLFRAGFTPLNAYRFGAALNLGRVRMGMRWTSKGYALLRRLFFSFSDIDWPQSVAYGISGGVYGGIFVNLQGREPSGAVPMDQYDRVRQDVKRMLLGLRHPGTGKPLVRQVLMREEIYRGTYLGELPDLYFLPESPTQAVFGDFEFSSNKVTEPASKAISAQHRMEGVFIARGPGVKRGIETGNMTVADFTPLVLYLMGLSIPEGLDGRLKTEILEEEELVRRPPAYFKPDAGRDAGGRRQAVDDESIKERLKGLGYIS
jgi:predicted AlkP superfamily phosphohydrolase/phosphomutase